MQCGSKKADNDAVIDTTYVAPVLDNYLTEQQKADGWQLLFDGKTTAGWRFFKDKENDSWEVTEGTLHCKPFDDAPKRADILTIAQYENFELAFDWKISTQGNSGVMFRVTEEYDEPYLSGPEYQVLDDDGYPGELKDAQLTGSNYDMHAATGGKLKSVGEWNSSKIIASGNHIEHWLNGKKVVEYQISSEEWLATKKASKWNDAKGYAASPKGHIDFQDHGGEVWYKNIMVKVL